MALQVSRSGFDPAAMLDLVKAHDFDHAEWLGKAMCKIPPAPTGFFDRIDRIDDDRRASHQRPLGNRVGNDVGGQTGRLIVSNTRTQHGSLDGIYPQIRSSEVISRRTSENSLADAWQAPEHDQHRKSVNPERETGPSPGPVLSNVP